MAKHETVLIKVSRLDGPGDALFFSCREFSFWFSISRVPLLSFDHNFLVSEA